MEWQLQRHHDGQTIDLHIRWEACEFVTVALHDVDRAFLRECDDSSLLSDKLLALEMLVRRIEQQREAKGIVATDDGAFLS